VLCKISILSITWSLFLYGVNVLALDAYSVVILLDEAIETCGKVFFN